MSRVKERRTRTFCTTICIPDYILFWFSRLLKILFSFTLYFSIGAIAKFNPVAKFKNLALRRIFTFLLASPPRTQITIIPNSVRSSLQKLICCTECAYSKAITNCCFELHTAICLHGLTIQIGNGLIKMPQQSCIVYY